MRLTPLLFLIACEATPATYVYGQALSDVEFDLYADDMGVYPSDAVLYDPNNPFAETGVSAQGKWDILDAGAWPATFYAWATLLASEPIGENQFYTATAAGEIWTRFDCDPDHLYGVWQIAIEGHQTVLDEFGDSLTYDATGTIAYPLAPISYRAIETLGGTPRGWTLVVGEDGTETLVAVPAPVEVD